MIHAMKTEFQHHLYQQLLDAAAMIAGRDGIAALSMSAVARKTGASKAALLHHFPNKQALISALFTHLLAIADTDISVLMLVDNEAYGCFTRAWINYLSNQTDAQESRHQLMHLLAAMPDAPLLRQRWREWMLKQLARGDALDNSHTGTLVRYAASGIWLSQLTEGPAINIEHRQALVNHLIKMTLPS